MANADSFIISSSYHRGWVLTKVRMSLRQKKVCAIADSGDVTSKDASLRIALGVAWCRINVVDSNMHLAIGFGRAQSS